MNERPGRRSLIGVSRWRAILACVPRPAHHRRSGSARQRPHNAEDGATRPRRHAEAGRRLHRHGHADRDLRRARAGRRGGARQSAGGARGAGDHRSGRSRWPTADAIVPTASISAIRRTVRCVRTAVAATERAAQATAGRVLLRGGAPASVYYSASCGGRTQLPSDVWPGAEDPSYLPSREDDACEGAPAWTAELHESDLQRALRASGFRGELRDLSIASRNASGRVARLKLDGLKPDQISGQDLRVAVGRTLGWQHIKSTAFELRKKDGVVPVQRSRVRPWRRHVRDRIRAPRRARRRRRRNPRALFPRAGRFPPPLVMRV